MNNLGVPWKDFCSEQWCTR